MSNNEPVMDGAMEDMSDGGTSKNEASDLMDAGRVDEVDPPDTVATGGLEEDPLANSLDEKHTDHTGV